MQKGQSIRKGKKERKTKTKRERDSNRPAIGEGRGGGAYVGLIKAERGLAIGEEMAPHGQNGEKKKGEALSSET